MRNYKNRIQTQNVIIEKNTYIFISVNPVKVASSTTKKLTIDWNAVVLFIIKHLKKLALLVAFLIPN